jgi:WD40 repeat protein
MNMSTAAILPGLSPFTAAQQKLFLGRKRQVDDLLSIMQSSRFIGVVGQAGSGKTSLIQAGLIPALERGFDGLAGKKWGIAYCRTGVTPIENLAAALAEENVLVEEGKSSLELQQEIVSELRKDHSGLLRVASQKELLKQKNLLIILDQFEDIFQFEALSKMRYEQWELDISLLFNNLARAVAAAKAPIYVLIGLRSSFLPRMYNYRSIQDYLNAGLYALPLLRQDDLKQIIHGSLQENSILLTEEAALFLEKGYDQNAHNLPFLQLCLQRLVHKRAMALPLQKGKEEPSSLPRITEATIDMKELSEWGDPTHGVAASLENFYNQQLPNDKVLMQQLFKLITRPGTLEDIQEPRTVSQVQEITEVPRSVLIRLLIEIQKAVPSVLEFIQPFTHKTDYLHEDSINDETIINIGNTYLVYQWQRLLDWINEERESRDTYLRLSERALLFEKGEAGYLIPPDLDVMLQWYSREMPKKAWAKQFNGIYRMAIDYLLNSKEEFELALERKEIARKREIQKIKKQRFFALVGILLLLFVWRDACNEKEIAENEEKRANNEAKKARIATEKASKAAKAALDSARAAQTQRMIAISQTEKAELETKAADNARKIANKNEKIALDLKKDLEKKIILVEASQKEAQDNADEADRQRTFAWDNAVKANNNRDFIESRSKIVALLNRVNSETFVSEDARIAFVDSLINNYNRYISTSQKLTGGKVVPFNDLYQLLTTVDWKILDNKASLFNSDRNLFTTESGLRDIDVYENSLIAAAGDDQRIVFFKPGNKPVPVETRQNKSRIRSIKILDESSVVFSNLSGEVFLLNRNAKTPVERERKLATLDQNIIPTLVLHNKQIFTLNKGMLTKIDINSGERKVLKTPAGALQLFELFDKRIIIKTASQVYLYDLNTETASALNIPADMPANKISSVALAPQFSFWGTDDGEIYICSPLSNTKLQRYKTIKPHKTKITSLLVDRESQQLITASMDNTANIFNISTNDYTSWEENVLILKGFRKWIWDLGLIKIDGRTELISVDEGGELLRWSTRMEDLYKDVMIWKDKNNER